MVSRPAAAHKAYSLLFPAEGACRQALAVEEVHAGLAAPAKTARDRRRERGLRDQSVNDSGPASIGKAAASCPCRAAGGQVRGPWSLGAGLRENRLPRPGRRDRIGRRIWVNPGADRDPDRSAPRCFGLRPGVPGLRPDKATRQVPGPREQGLGKTDRPCKRNSETSPDFRNTAQGGRA